MQVSNAKSKGIFFGIKSWSQMIQNCLIRREIAKKKFGGKWRFSAVEAVPPPIFLDIREICPKSKLLPFLTIGLR